MQYPTSSPRYRPVVIKVSLQETGTVWVLLVACLFLLRLPANGWTIRPVLVGSWRTLVAATTFAIAHLLVSLLAKPLVFRIDAQSDTLTCMRLGFPWKKTLPLRQVSSQLSKQRSHAGTTHYLLLFTAGKQVLALQESPWWPLASLQRLQQLLRATESK